MDRRIKIVWWLSIATMILIFCGQAYWLYTQYQYSGDKIAEQLKQDCSDALTDEEHIRQTEAGKKPRHGRDTVRIQVNAHIDMRSQGRTHGHTTTMLAFTLEDGREITLSGHGISIEDGATILNRYRNNRFHPLRNEVIDSLLAAKGYDGMCGFRRIKSRDIHIEPQYRVSEGLHKVLHVTYSDNPMLHQTVLFDLPVPVSKIIRSMVWQLIASLLLLIVLAFCLIYQIKTIMIQKRIDGIRHEFMKNMIYEMKQPREETTEEGVAHIGDTEFRYDQNELQHGNERVILTSRQAEILKILSDSPNQIVPREQILMAAWGDDSYANSMALNVQISYLRRALRSDIRLSIDVIYKKGYILNIRRLPQPSR